MGGVFTIPKWVVYDIVLPTLYLMVKHGIPAPISIFDWHLGMATKTVRLKLCGFTNLFEL